MNYHSHTLLLFILITFLGGCDPRGGHTDMAVEGAMKMDDWHFKIVIADIELHKVRTGAYPETLSDLKFISKEDLRAISGVSYTRLDTGYELNFARNRTAEQLPHYPKEFWQGLGLVRSNLKHD